jgi:hypothetical protein
MSLVGPFVPARSEFAVRIEWGLLGLVLDRQVGICGHRGDYMLWRTLAELGKLPAGIERASVDSPTGSTGEDRGF